MFCTNNNRFIFPGVSPQVGNNILLLFFKSKQKIGKAKHSLESNQQCLLLQLKDDHEGCPIRRSLFLAPGAPSLSLWMFARIYVYCQNKSKFLSFNMSHTYVVGRIMATSMRMGCQHQPVGRSAFLLTLVTGGYAWLYHRFTF